MTGVTTFSHPATANKNKSRPGECQYQLDDDTTRLCATVGEESAGIG